MALGVFAALVNLPVRERRDRAPAQLGMKTGACVARAGRRRALALAACSPPTCDPHLVVDLANRIWACF